MLKWLRSLWHKLIEELDAPQKQEEEARRHRKRLEEAGRHLIRVGSIIHRFDKSLHDVGHYKSPHTK
jgi:hypothetical protein